MEPDNNVLLAFPSWSPHEVRPVIVASGRFDDCRLAIDRRVYRAKRVAPSA